MRAKALRLSKSPEFAFRRRYGLSPRDPRFLECSMEDILVDLHAHRYADDPKLEEEEFEDPGYEDELERLEAEMAAKRPVVVGEEDWENV